MSQQTKEVPLNGAYYGPPIPPQQPRHCRRRSCCLLSSFMKLLIGIVVVVGIAALIFWLVVRPTKVKFHVNAADLTQFDLTNGNTLNYNLSLNMAIRNPNKKIGIYYDRLEARAEYEGERFGWDPLPEFYQGHKNTTDLQVNFRGQSLIILRGSEINRFNQAKNSGVYYIDVKIHARIRFKIGSIKTRRYKPHIECNLRIPLASNGTTVTTGFERKRCDIDY